jgi:hypothetical protein
METASDMVTLYRNARTACLPVIARITLRKVKATNALDGTNWSADILWDNRKVGVAYNNGDGGETHVRFEAANVAALIRNELAAAQGATAVEAKDFAAFAPSVPLAFGLVDAIDVAFEEHMFRQALKKQIAAHHRKGRHVIICGDMLFSAAGNPIIPAIGDRVNGYVVTEVHLCTRGAK